MSKRYDEVIEVSEDPLERVPLQFSWRGRGYEVDRVLGEWREAGPERGLNGYRNRRWLRILAHLRGASATGELDADGFPLATGAVYELCLDLEEGTWKLGRLWD